MPTEDKITELSAWQKRNKEYLEKRALEKEKEPEKDELEEETSTEEEDLLDQEVASVDEEDSDERERKKRTDSCKTPHLPRDSCYWN